MAKVIDRFKADKVTAVTPEYLDGILRSLGIKTPAAIFAARMREKGWLESTSVRGVWRFLIGEDTETDILFDVESFAFAHPDIWFALSGETALWYLGYLSREPRSLALCFVGKVPALTLPSSIHGQAFEPVLPLKEEEPFPCLSVESAIVSVAAKPQMIEEWRHAFEWLPKAAIDLDTDRVIQELEGRPSSVAARTGYLLQGVRPDIAERIYETYPPRGIIRFGPRASTLRNDTKWCIVDTMLPFDPRTAFTRRAAS